jgi:16S rRNA (uracil1498-N3)-methyltransferase
MVGALKGRAAGKVRLHVPHPLASGQEAPLTREQAHYLTSVMRLGPGDMLTAFDGRSGAWAARILDAGRKGGRVEAMSRTAPQRDPPDLWLLFAPLRKARTDFVVEKAVELGARRILPVQTEHTNADRIRRDRLQAHAIEAAEQCGGTFVPEVGDLAPLPTVLGSWPPGRALAFADEALADDPDWSGPGEAGAWPPAPAAVLVGPEGGFSDAERARIRSMPEAAAVTLGPRILRADTAAVAALALWQSARGDWAVR